MVMEYGKPLALLQPTWYVDYPILDSWNSMAKTETFSRSIVVRPGDESRVSELIPLLSWLDLHFIDSKFWYHIAII